MVCLSYQQDRALQIRSHGIRNTTVCLIMSTTSFLGNPVDDVNSSIPTRVACYLRELHQRLFITILEHTTERCKRFEVAAMRRLVAWATDTCAAVSCCINWSIGSVCRPYCLLVSGVFLCLELIHNRWASELKPIDT